MSDARSDRHSDNPNDNQANGRIGNAIDCLLHDSLTLWAIDGRVDRIGQDVIVILVDDVEVKIERAASDLPFRWWIDDGTRRRTAASVTGMLRAVRLALDGGYAPLALTIAPLQPPA